MCNKVNYVHVHVHVFNKIVSRKDVNNYEK